MVNEPRLPPEIEKPIRRRRTGKLDKPIAEKMSYPPKLPGSPAPLAQPETFKPRCFVYHNSFEWPAAAVPLNEPRDLLKIGNVNIGVSGQSCFSFLNRSANQ